jgi:hypothetical protein
MRRVNRLVVFSVALLIGAEVRAQDARIFPILNAGQPAVCADFLKGEAEHDEAFRQWLLGFWSGMNVGERSSAGQVGRSTSATGIIGELALFCESHPSLAIDQAAFAVRQKFRAAAK